MTDETCKACAWSKFHGVPTLDCRRHSPMIDDPKEVPTGRSCAVWPQVSERDWCGDFSPRPAE